ncbi:MAG: DUF349 domain-containing protein [Tahibacter sp.]
MKLARLFFKPKWQHRDAAIRRNAVAAATDAELVDALPTLCRSDEDAGVRQAALRRLNQYEAWRERSTGDSDGAIRVLARNHYLALLIGNSGSVPALDRRIAELDTLSAEELERVASQAQDRELRRAAMERVSRMSLLVDWASGDSDASLRAAALARINDPDALLRVAERTRKTDKNISRVARERAEELRIAAGDSATIEQRARQLCERLEALLPIARSERTAELANLDSAWRGIANHASAKWVERFSSTRVFLQSDTDAAAGQRERLRELRERLAALAADANSTTQEREQSVASAQEVLDGVSAEMPERGRVEELLVQLMRKLAADATHPVSAVALPPETTPVDPAEALAAQARFNAALASAQAETQRQRERERSLREELDARVIELEQSLEAGDIGLAQSSHTRILALLDDLPPIARHDKRLANALARLTEFRRWQRWSNTERRKQLCESIESLAGSGLHPDAVANRVREARLEWQALDQAEGAPAGDALRARQGLARRFQSLCNDALAPTQEYFSKRDEVRKSHQEEIEKVIAVAEAIPTDSEDWTMLAQQRRLAGETLRKLDAVDARARTPLARRIKELLTRLDARLDAHAAAVEAAKRALIEQAEKLSTATDAIAAAREVRDLQGRWKTAGSGRRKTDEGQWKLFRGHCDAIFARLDTQRKDREDRDVAAREETERLVGALESLAMQEASDATRASRRELEQQWAGLARDRAVETRWRAALERLDQAQTERERARRLSVFVALGQRLRICQEREQGVRDASLIDADWNRVDAVAGETGALLEQRFLAAQQGAALQLSSADLEQAHDLLVHLEFLAAVATPEIDRQRRMDLQVQRLSQRMTGGRATDLREELLGLLHEWVALGALPTVEAAELQARFELAFSTALQLLP